MIMIYTWRVTWTERDRSGTGVERFRSESAARDYAARELASAVDVDVRPIDQAAASAPPADDVAAWHARLRAIAAAANRPPRPRHGQSGRWT
jgi:hypothetical protein